MQKIDLRKKIIICLDGRSRKRKSGAAFHDQASALSTAAPMNRGLKHQLNLAAERLHNCLSTAAPMNRGLKHEDPTELAAFEKAFNRGPDE